MSNCNKTVGVTVSHVKLCFELNGNFKFKIMRCLVLTCDMVTPTDFEMFVFYGMEIMDFKSCQFGFDV